MINPKLYVKQLEDLFEANRNVKNAIPMKRYMREQFDFYGIKSPLRKELLKQFLENNSKPAGEELKQIVQLLWNNKHREMQYVAMDIMEKVVKKLDESFLPFFEKLVLQKSWWDTVDWIAANGFGRILKKYPKHIKPVTERWIQSDNIWLQRTALIFQLKFGKHTDKKILFDYILYRADSKEFFIQKASGWALRQYSKYNAKEVIEFIRDHEAVLSKLTKKEGLKWLERNKEN